jgi:hypothetical protein
MTTTIVSRPCIAGMHACCRETRETCACTDCHLGPCAQCGAGNLQRIYTSQDGCPLCASCYRSTAKAAPSTVTLCDKCGNGPAFRNPGHRRNEYLCRDCHAATGEPVVLTSSMAGFVLECKGQDIDSDLHSWVHIRGTRFRCLCGANRYDAAMRDSERRKWERELFSS